MHPDKFIYLHALNLKMSITKLTRVLNGPPKDYMLQNVSLSDLENPNTATYDRIALRLCAYSKLVSLVVKIKSLKSYKR